MYYSIYLIRYNIKINLFIKSYNYKYKKLKILILGCSFNFLSSTVAILAQESILRVHSSFPHFVLLVLGMFSSIRKKLLTRLILGGLSVVCAVLAARSRSVKLLIIKPPKRDEEYIIRPHTKCHDYGFDPRKYVEELGLDRKFDPYFFEWLKPSGFFDEKAGRRKKCNIPNGYPLKEICNILKVGVAIDKVQARYEEKWNNPNKTHYEVSMVIPDLQAYLPEDPTYPYHYHITLPFRGGSEYLIDAINDEIQSNNGGNFLFVDYVQNGGTLRIDPSKGLGAILSWYFYPGTSLHLSIDLYPQNQDMY